MGSANGLRKIERVVAGWKTAGRAAVWPVIGIVPLASVTPGWTQKRPQDFSWGLFVSGASGGIRTHDPCLRRAVLYPAELRMRCGAQSYACPPEASMLASGSEMVPLRRF